VSTPAFAIRDLSFLVLAIVTFIFVVVAGVTVYAILRYRRRPGDDGRDPPQVYGSTQIELAWTVVPFLIVIILFLTTTRYIFAIERPAATRDTVEVTGVGNQWWWEIRYPQLGIVTANELHVPVSDAARPPGTNVGPCAAVCGVQHAWMLLRVTVHPRDEFDRWVAAQRAAAADVPEARAGRDVFTSVACISCHTVRGTPGNGVFGPDLTHLMSRATIGAGVAPNTPENLRAWVNDPAALKPGARMPAMKLSNDQLDQLLAFLVTLR